MRSAPSRPRFSCGAGLLFVAVAALAISVVSQESVAWGDAPAEGGVAPSASAGSPDDLVLDLGGVTLQTRKVTHGSFTMGASANEPGHDKDEEPAHHVTITKDYWIGKYPVTRGQFAKFVADTRYVTEAEKGASGGQGWDGKTVPDGGKAGPVLVQRKDFNWRNPGFTQTDEHPVVLVSYGDANAFVGWASRKSGKRVRLPTEAEWEYAARGGTTTSWSGGAAAESDPTTVGWFRHNAGNGTRPVGQKKPNPLGLFDMSGNVMEWCRDVYAPYREGALVDPESTTNTGTEPERRVLRGGSWYRDPKRGRSAARFKVTPGTRNADNGFRVVVTNEETITPAVTGPGPDFVPSGPLGAAPSGASSAGPLADGEPLRTEPVGHSSEAFSWGLLLASPVAAASAVVAWMLLRRKRTPGASSRVATRSGISTRAGADGFFVRAPDVPAGSRLRYACMVNGAEVSDVVPLDGGRETFVYTGAAPTAIRVLEILSASRAAVARVPERRQDSQPPMPIPYVESVIIETASPSPPSGEVDVPEAPQAAIVPDVPDAPDAPDAPDVPDAPDAVVDIERTEPLPPIALATAEEPKADDPKAEEAKVEEPKDEEFLGNPRAY